MAGGFVLVVGPSGAGKDTLIELARTALARDPRFLFPKRLVTRPKSPFEDHDTISEDEFKRGVASECFALAWRAHGFGYALPASLKDAALAGRIVVCNVSRQVVEEARRRLLSVAIVAVTAPRRVLAERLRSRGREGDAAIDERLERSKEFCDLKADCLIVNDKSPAAAAAELVAFLHTRLEGGSLAPAGVLQH